MIKVSMREFTHHISEYMERVNKGEKFVIIRRNQPLADLAPHHSKRIKSGWSLEKPKLKLKNLSLSDELLKIRREERS